MLTCDQVAGYRLVEKGIRQTTIDAIRLPGTTILRRRVTADQERSAMSALKALADDLRRQTEICCAFGTLYLGSMAVEVLVSWYFDRIDFLRHRNGRGTS